MKALRIAPANLTAHLKSSRPKPIHQLQRRTFVPNPFAGDSSPSLQTLTASRTLSYPSNAIYDIIADVSSYSSFLPFCLSSEVTRWSASDNNGKKWPSEASIQVGWGSIRETFQSRIYCVPGRIVEAVGGESETELSGSDIAHHHEGPSPFKAENRALGGENGNSTILTHLQSRWTLNPFPYKPPPLTRERRIDPSAQADMPSRDQTEVHLSLSFAFANPIYSAMSSAVTPKVAGIMIEAFEKRVATLLEPGKGGATQTLGKLDGVLARDKP